MFALFEDIFDYEKDKEDVFEEECQCVQEEPELELDPNVSADNCVPSSPG